MDHDEAGGPLPGPARAPAPGLPVQVAGFLDVLPVGVAYWGTDLQLVHANPVLRDLLGLAGPTTPTLIDLVVADDRERATEAIDDLLAGRRNSAQVRMAGAAPAAPAGPAPHPGSAPSAPVGRAGAWPLHAHLTVAYGADGSPTGLLAQVFDFRPAPEGGPLPAGLSRVFEQGADILLVVEQGGRVSYANRAARHALDLGDAGPGTLLWDLLDTDGQELFEAIILPRLAREGAWQGEITLRAPTGRLLPASASFVAHGQLAVGREGRLVGDLSVFARDITELKNAERRLRQLATHDYLTGLPNRLLLYDRLELALNRYQRYGTPVALLFCDLDGFKPVNDRYGHQVGDAVLVAVADRIHSVVRDTDTAARVGGDEFAVLIEGVDELDQLTAVADRLVDRVAEPVEVAGVRAQVGISIGLVVASPGCREVDAMVALADSAMYRAKAEGRGRYVVVAGDVVPGA